MREHEQNTVKIGLQAMPFQLHQPRHGVAKQGACRPMDMVARHQIHCHDRAERPRIGPALLDEFDATIPQQHLGIDDVHVFER